MRCAKFARIGLFAILLGALFFSPLRALAQSPFTGTVQRPFPTLMPLDYSSCRAQAWLLALQKAATALPPFVDIRLRELDLDSRLGRLAMAALLYPVDVITPDISASVDITVYLRESRPTSAEAGNILRDPETLILEMCLIAEIEEKIRQLREIWPSGLDVARERLKELEFYSNGLNGLWDALKFNAGAKAGFAAVSRAAEAIGDSPVAFHMEASSLLDAARPQRALDASSAGIREARRRLAAGKHDNLWRLALAKCLYARGIAHWRLNQPALAEADFDAGIAALKDLEHRPATYPLLLLGRGALRGLLRNTEGMCEDYVEACGLGKCQGLYEARARGMCGRNAK